MSICWQDIFNSTDVLKINQDIVTLNVAGIVNYSDLRAEHIVFVGGKKYWKEVTARYTKEAAPLFFVIDETFYADIVDLLDKEIKENNYFILCSNVQDAMCDISYLFFQQQTQTENDLVDGRQLGSASIHPTAWIAQNVFIGKDVKIDAGVKIYPGCVIMSGSHIGVGTVVYPNVVVYPRTVIGKQVIVHAGTAIGIDGYGFNFIAGEHKKIWHLGNVVIEDRVEIGGNCTIDRGTFGSTIIRHGTKIDNQVHVAHNVIVGEKTLLCGQVGIAGSVKIGDYCVFGGRVGVSDGVTIGNQVQVGGGSVVSGNVEDKSVLAGYPARPIKEWLRGLAFVRKSSLKK